MARVIDALVVTLGLDPKGYKKGAADAKAAQAGLKQSAQADANVLQETAEKGGTSAKKLGAEKRKQDGEERKRQRQREREAKQQDSLDKRRNDDTVSRIKSLGLAAAGAVLGFNTVKGAIEAYFGATNQLANLGRVAPTIGTDVKALDVLGDAYKQVGGKADEAGADIAKLAHAQFSFAINAPDALAGWARRLGVSLFDDKGNSRDKVTIQKDIAAALQRQTTDLQTQAMYAREMGMSESFIQLYLVKSASERAKILKDSEATAKATEKGAAAAARQEQATSRLKNHLKAAGESIVSKIAPGIAVAADAISNTLDGTEKGDAADQRMLGTLGITAQKFNPQQYKGASPYDAQFAAAEKKYGLPTGLLSSIAHQESNFNPSAVNSKSGATGLMQLMPKYFPSAGKDVNADIDTAAAELARKYKGAQRYFGKDAALSLAIAEYNDGEGNVGKRLKRGQQLPQETTDYVSQVENAKDYATRMGSATAPASSGMGGGSSTVVHNTTNISELNMHTKATDGPGVAASFVDTLKRQNVVSQANTGMN